MDINVIYNEKGRDRLYKTWHTPENNMLIYISEGNGSIVLSDRVYELKKGVLCFIAGKCFHYTMPDRPENYLRSKVFFSQTVLDKICDFTDTDFYKNNSVIYAQIPKEHRREVEKLFYEIKKEPASVNGLSCLLKITAFLQKYTKQLCDQPKGFIATTVSYINTHINESISIDELCKNVHMSKYHFCRKFKSYTNQTVMEYILGTRLIAAAHLIVATDLSIGEISERCGMCSISYFSRVFKKQYGMSPLKYRNQNTK